MTHFAGECFLFNLHLKGMRFELFLKPLVDWSTKSAENLKLWFPKRPTEVFYKKFVLRTFYNIHRKTPTSESLFNKVTDPASLLKRDFNIGLFLRFCKLFKNTYFKKTSPNGGFYDLKHGIRVFHDFIFFVYSTANNIQTKSLVLAEILCVLFTLRSPFASDWKENFKLGSDLKICWETEKF